MERFDPEEALHLIEKYKVTSAQWVPTHFVRMLKLPKETQTKYDLSSLKMIREFTGLSDSVCAVAVHGPTRADRQSHQ